MSSQRDMKEGLEHAGQCSSSVAISMNNRLDAISSSSPKYTIFKVHELLRRVNEMAYEPEILAIGPYHRGQPRLQVMEDQKLRWVKKCLEDIDKHDVSEYVEAMKRLEPEARECYSESTSHVNEDDFVEMMLLDGCFIIQFMRRWLDYNQTKPFLEDWAIASLMRDVLIFENQIPLFVLEELFSMIRLPQEPSDFQEFALLYFKDDVLGMMLSDTIPKDAILSTTSNDVHHMLGFLHDLLRSLDTRNNNNKNPVDEASWSLQHMIKLCGAGIKFYFTRSFRRGRDIHIEDAESHAAQNYMLNTVSRAKGNAIKLCQAGFKFITTRSCWRGRFDHAASDSESIPSATELHAAGVQFKSKKVQFTTKKVRKSQLSSPFGISFKNGVMEIPTFSIEDYTESLYRNLIAYEQYSQQSSDRCVALYASLMDYLIDSAEDVALLRKHGIIVNALGDDGAVSTIFNKLVNHVIVSNRASEVHSKLFKEVNAYCGKRRHRWMAKLRRDYFNNPWALISFLAAFFLLVLTLIQTVFSILGVL